MQLQRTLLPTQSGSERRARLMEHLADTSARPLVMGIVNLTPDSFSDGGLHDSREKGVAHALELVEAGADWIDFGGESTRPGSAPVPEEIEIERVIPVVNELRSRTSILVSVDTRKARVAELALAAGADVINDISALRHDPHMATVVRDMNAPIVLMHMLGEPTTMQENPKYDNCVNEVFEFLRERIRFATMAGISSDRIIVDPGIGFGKRLEDNLAILREFSRFTDLGVPLLVGVSRKRFIDGTTGKSTLPEDRLGGSIAGALLAVIRGARIVRVHDVWETVEALAVWWRIHKESAQYAG